MIAILWEWWFQTLLQEILIQKLCMVQESMPCHLWQLPWSMSVWMRLRVDLCPIFSGNTQHLGNLFLTLRQIVPESWIIWCTPQVVNYVEKGRHTRTLSVFEFWLLELYTGLKSKRVTLTIIVHWKVLSCFNTNLKTTLQFSTQTHV